MASPGDPVKQQIQPQQSECREQLSPCPCSLVCSLVCHALPPACYVSVSGHGWKQSIGKCQVPYNYLTSSLITARFWKVPKLHICLWRGMIYHRSRSKMLKRRVWQWPGAHCTCIQQLKLEHLAAKGSEIAPQHSPLDLLLNHQISSIEFSLEIRWQCPTPFCLIDLCLEH